MGRVIQKSSLLLGVALIVLVAARLILATVGVWMPEVGEAFAMLFSGFGGTLLVMAGVETQKK